MTSQYGRITQIFIVASLLQISISTNSFGQIVSNVAKYTICQWDRFSNAEYDCEKKWGQFMFSKIAVTPNKQIFTTFLKGAEVVEYKWDKSKVRMNEDKTRYIYDLLERDINFEGGLMIVIFFHLDYSIQFIKVISNIQGTIISSTLYTE